MMIVMAVVACFTVKRNATWEPLEGSRYVFCTQHFHPIHEDTSATSNQRKNIIGK